MSITQPYETVAVAASLFLAGTISAVSMLAVPVALETCKTDAALLRQWRAIYANGHMKGPTIASIVGAALATIAVLKSSQGEDPTTTSIAAVAAAGIVPYTWIVMSGVNGRLHSVAAETGSGTVDVRREVVTWSRMNAVRGALPLVGGLVCLWGLFVR